MKKQSFSALPTVLCFALVIALGLILHLSFADRDYSENENRYLAQAPRFTLKALFSGGFTADFEDYITDQFPFRDSWLDVKSRAERLSGKTENNGVFFGKDDTLISRFPQPEEKSITAGIAAVNALRENTGIPVVFALVPSAAEVWKDRLPASADTADQAALIRRIYEGVDAATVDMLSALSSHASEDIYYRTDHHWTTLGAYYGYAATAEALGLTPQPKESFRPVTVSDSFFGTVYSSSGVRWVKPDTMERWVPDSGVTLTRYDSPEGTVSPVYDESRLEVKDKYSYYLGGNVSRAVIETGHGGGKLLVLRDSYADCELPFFFAHYAEIHVLDLRYFRQSVSEYTSGEDFDAILVSYSLSDFLSDPAVALMGT